jgi:hypothetical protein
MAQVEPDAGQELLSERVAGSILPRVSSAPCCTCSAGAPRRRPLPAAGSGS